MIAKELCTGCSACVAVCSINAIQMREEGGFLYPWIDEKICIQCGKCERVCPIGKETPFSVSEEKQYMVYAKDAQLRKESSSGGVFSLLAEKVLESGGCVYGSAMTADYYGAHHICVSDQKELGKLRGSKYVQSALEETFVDAQKKLKNGDRVLFTGTPCQIAGLQNFLNHNYENLLTVDVICHGVPSPMVWRKYAQALEERYGSKLTAVSFRNKTHGWKKYSLSCRFENGERYQKMVGEDLYLRGFIMDLYLRNSCYQCQVKGKGYRSDITIGDFWGVEGFFPEESRDEGISVVISHTEKGTKAIEALEKCEQNEISSTFALSANPNYNASVAMNPLRKRAIREIEKRGTEKTLEKYCGISLSSRLRRRIAKLFFEN